MSNSILYVTKHHATGSVTLDRARVLKGGKLGKERTVAVLGVVSFDEAESAAYNYVWDTGGGFTIIGRSVYD